MVEKKSFLFAHIHFIMFCFVIVFQGFADKNRSSKQFNHLMTVKEAIPMLGWVTVVSDQNRDFPLQMSPCPGLTPSAEVVEITNNEIK